MSHIKITGPDAWDYGEQQAMFIKRSSRGLIGHDRSVLIKRAGAGFVELAKKVKFEPDEVPLHIIAMCASEAYSANRNGDGFKEATLRKWHPTFVKLAKVYQLHKNKNPQKSYGVVKLSYYDEEMRRVLLLAALNKTAEAARRNGGLVDEAFVNDAEAGKDIPFSMACKIANDVCAICQNVAPTRDDYCESEKQGGSCPGFGCKDGLTQVLEDGRVQHVDNPDPRFFDISKVRRPAERTAYGGLADYLTKAAQASHHIGGAELAELLGAESPGWLSAVGDGLNIDVIKTAHELSHIETEIEHRLATLGDLDAVSTPSLGDISGLDAPDSAAALDKLAALSELQVVLSPSDFVQWLCQTRRPEKVANVCRYLPGIYSRWVKSGEIVNLAVANPFAHNSRQPSFAARKWAAKFASSALSPREMTKQAFQNLAAGRVAEPQPRVKMAAVADETTDCQVAELYAAYKLAFITSQDNEMPLTAWFAVRQNYE